MAMLFHCERKSNSMSYLNFVVFTDSTIMCMLLKLGVKLKIEISSLQGGGAFGNKGVCTRELENLN